MRPTTLKLAFVLLLLFVTTNRALSQAPSQVSRFHNPILPGFNPDPSITRVDDDFYIATSSFVMFPGIPIYHSKDLVNWELIGHAISNAKDLKFDGLKDEKGIWAPTLRFHKGVYYIFSNCNQCGGNFFVTAQNPRGPWTEPVWLKDAPGVDPSPFWDDDGKSYYLGNEWGFKGARPGQVIIWMQQIDLLKGQLIGEKRVLTSGYANNAAYTEGPHLYKIDGRYLLLVAEGGSGPNHAVTAHHSSSLWGPYTADQINPVLSHRQLGVDYPIQAAGHADLVQTQDGDWWAVCLAERVIHGSVPLARETFLSKVEMQDGTPIFNPGAGSLLQEQERPSLPWSPLGPPSLKTWLQGREIPSDWETIRTSTRQFLQLGDGRLTILLSPETLDDLSGTSNLVRRIKDFHFSFTTSMQFSPMRDGEEAGLTVYRQRDNYISFLKGKSAITVIRKENGKKAVVSSVPYVGYAVCLRVETNDLGLRFSYGQDASHMSPLGLAQSMSFLSENQINRFNGPVVGLYATSNRKPSKANAIFTSLEYVGLP
jgi:xylan 1,4-beta-xylosidase